VALSPSAGFANRSASIGIVSAIAMPGHTEVSLFFPRAQSASGNLSACAAGKDLNRALHRAQIQMQQLMEPRNPGWRKVEASRRAALEVARRCAANDRVSRRRRAYYAD